MADVDEQSWRLHSPITNSTNNEASTSCDNPLDWTCEDVKGRATGLFFPLEKDDVLVKEGMERPFVDLVYGRFGLISTSHL